MLKKEIGSDQYVYKTKELYKMTNESSKGQKMCIRDRTLNVTLISRDGMLKILGTEQSATQAKKLIEELVTLAGRGNTITRQNVSYALSLDVYKRQDVSLLKKKQVRHLKTAYMLVEMLLQVQLQLSLLWELVKLEQKVSMNI